MMILYHGSYEEVSNPLAKVGRKNLDFGRGFYLTKVEKQAYSWATAVAERKGRDIYSEYDVIEGGIADDKVIDTVEDYEKGIITAEQAIGQLIMKEINHQICIINQQVIDKYLTFVKSITL